MLNDLDRWFIAEILPHESALVRYLRRVWPNAADVLDLQQEAYVRVYESARHGHPRSPKAFLFATARNLLTDHIRRSRVVPIDTGRDLEIVNTLVDELTPERVVSAHEELLSLAHALDTLSDKCRSVVWLRRVEGLSQRDTARRLGLKEGAVESQLARGMQALAEALFGRIDEASIDATQSHARIESRLE